MLYAKAIAATVMGLVAPFGVSATTSFEDGLVLLISAAITGFTVWAVPNKQ